MGNINEDMTFRTLNVTGTLTAPDNALGDREHSSGRPLSVTKARQAPLAQTTFGLEIGDTVAARERVVHVADGDETVRGFRCGLDGACTSGSVSFDLKKNGSSILTGTVDFSSSDGDRDIKSGTLDSTTLADGDWLSVEITTATGADGTGPFAVAELDVRLS